MAKTYDEYKQQAQQEYDPSYNAKIAAINAALNSNLTTLENQKSGIEATYANQESDQNQQNTLNKNEFDNVNSARGLGRSTILTTGLAGMDDQNTKILSRIKQAKTNDINAVDAQKSTLTTNTNNQIAQMAGDRESELAALIRQYQMRDEDIDFRNKQFDESKRQYDQNYNRGVLESDRSYQLQRDQFNLSKSRAASGGSKSSGSNGKKTMSKMDMAWESLRLAMNKGTASDWLSNNAQSLKDTIGESGYKKLYDAYYDEQAKKTYSYSNIFNR